MNHPQGLFSQSGVFAVLDDTHDLEVVDAVGQAYAAANRILARKEMPGERLVDDHHVVRRTDVVLVDVAPRRSGICIVAK